MGVICIQIFIQKSNYMCQYYWNVSWLYLAKYQFKLISIEEGNLFYINNCPKIVKGISLAYVFVNFLERLGFVITQRPQNLGKHLTHYKSSKSKYNNF